MLESNDKKKIEKYIDDIISNLRKGANENLNNGMRKKVVLDKLVDAAVHKLAPESKYILSSVYNMMMDKTLAGPGYQDSARRVEFYEMNIFKEINDKFDFDVPSSISYEESRAIVNKWTETGAVAVAGGIISLSMRSLAPVGIAILIAALMAILLEDKKEGGDDIHIVIEKYLKNVKDSLMVWIKKVEEYYDTHIAEFEKQTGNSNE